MSLLDSTLVNNGGDDACGIQRILDEAWRDLATNDLGELEKTIERLKSICDDTRLQAYSIDDLLAARRTCKRLRALLNRRGRDLLVISQLNTAFRRETCQH